MSSVFLIHSRKDIQFIAICVTAVALAFIVVHLLWAPAEPEVSISRVDVAKYAYIASVNSEVFHEPDCRSAKQISERNLIGFNTRDDAVHTGRRPCKICKP